MRSYGATVETSGGSLQTVYCMTKFMEALAMPAIRLQRRAWGVGGCDQRRCDWPPVSSTALALADISYFEWSQ
jgi:hypothetical protein